MKQKIERSLFTDQREIQHLILSSKMQQALHLLQLPILELSSFVETEIEQNPLLEILEKDFRKEPFFTHRESSDLKQFIENTLPYENSLFEHLLLQARAHFSTKDDLECSEALIGHLDENGFLTTSLEEIALFINAPPEKLERILQEIQKFEPLGIGARNIQESLLLQLEHQGKKETLLYEIIRDTYPSMDLKPALQKELSGLALYPGKNFSLGHYKEITPYITPDIYIESTPTGLRVELNDHHIPLFRLNPHYIKVFKEANAAAKEYIEEKLTAAHWLLRNLQEREHTLVLITQEIVKKQQHFFTHPDGNLLPFQMKEVAEKVDLHESTIARACANKYVSTPRGVYPLRFFFIHGFTSSSGESVSAQAVEEEIKNLIQKEDPHHPLSDEQIMQLLKAKKIEIARRTVAKYRQKLGIGSTAQRRV